MSPEVAAAIVGAVALIVATLITALVPSLLRRTRGAVEAEGAATRDAMDAFASGVHARIDDLRADVHELRDWQTSHTAEHVLLRDQPHSED
ncbi:hypothetical protein [Streptomyces asiaticus]|uniref:hypothetical protein n=1 Tax=Streptomyces asiaticus TaxID=114695 RepID=UPI001BAAEFD6|nr:hypothetical protein [Streptomyces asiaticus]